MGNKIVAITLSILLQIIFINKIYTQKAVTDSLLFELSKAESDTLKIDVLNELTKYLIRSFPDSALQFAKQVEKIAIEINATNKLAESYKNIGNIYYGKDNFYLADSFYHKSLSIYKETNNTLGKAKIYNNLGALNKNKGNLKQTLEYYHKSLELRTALGDRNGMGKTYNNIGNVHLSRGNLDLALDYYSKSLDIRKTFNDKLGLSGCYANIGVVHIEKQNYSLAIKYFKEAYKIYEDFEDIFGKSQCQKHLGICYLHLGDQSLSLEYLTNVLKTEIELGDKIGMASSLTLMANAYNKIGNYKLAEKHAQKSNAIADELKILSLKKDNFEQLYIANEGLGNYKTALNYHKLLLASHDSIFNLEKLREFELVEAEYQSENKQLQIENLQNDNELNALKLEKMRIRQIFSYGIILTAILIIISLSVLRYKLSKKNGTIFEQTEEILSQKEELENHRNHLEKLVQERTKDLKIAKEKAEKSDLLKTAFLANMSHEIRTPLNAIVGFSNLFSEENLSKEESKEYSRLIQSNSSILINLINDIIDIAKIESGNFAIMKSKIEINTLTQSIFHSFKQIINLEPNKQIEFLFKPESAELIYITTDENRLKQVLNNLIGNAIKFTDSGIVIVGYTIANDFIHFYVTDTGIGIKPDEIKNLFKRFTKIDTPSNKFYRGTGIGLAISKHIVELLKGEIWVESKINEGSTFHFKIPNA